MLKRFSILMIAILALFVLPKMAGADVVLEETFEGVTPPDFPTGWSVENTNGDSKYWETYVYASGYYNHTPNGSTSARYSYSLSEDADDWFFTEALSLSSDKGYKLEFWYMAGLSSWPEKMEVKIGDDDTSTAMSIQLWDNDNIDNEAYLKGEATFTVSSSGTYYIGFHCYSEANMYKLYVDDIKLESFPGNDMGVVSIEDPPAGSLIEGNSSLAVKVTVQNFGGNTQGPGVPVKLEITGPGGYNYTDSEATTSSLDMGDTEQITFVPDWSVPNTAGTYTIKSWTELSGEQDPSNDTTTIKVKVYLEGSLYEGFEAEAFPPIGWKVYNFDGGDAWERSTWHSHTGDASAYIHYDTPNNDWLITPKLVCSASVPDTLEFWHRAQSSAYTEVINVRLSTTSTDTTAFTTTLTTVLDSTTDWKRTKLSLDGYDGSCVYIAFQCVSDDQLGWFLDDVYGPLILPPVILKAQVAGESHYRSFWANGSWDSLGYYDDMWSGPMVELKDDGSWPDSASGDNIFTGAVVLMVDSVNTYNWWVGSEDTITSFLEDGSGFQVLDPANPPTVSTCVVDPSNTGYNDWIICLSGDFNGWNNSADNLTRDGTVWSGKVSLTAGNHEYKYTVMHSWNATYGYDPATPGIAAIPGDNIPYNAPQTADYLFEFDDADNSYSVTPLVNPNQMVINEFKPSGTEQIELYNTSGGTLDSAAVANLSLIFPRPINPDTISVGDWVTGDVPAEGYLVCGPLSDFLDDGYGLFLLVNAFGDTLDMVGYGMKGGAPHSDARFSVARTPNGQDTDNDAADFNVDPTPTFGAANDAPGVALGTSLIINEVYRGSDAVELYNPTLSGININGWFFCSGDTMEEITADQVIPAGSVYVLYQDSTGSFTDGLGSDDVAYLFNPDTVRVDQVGWKGYPYHPGHSLQKIPDGAGPHDGYDWTTSGGDSSWFVKPATLGSLNQYAYDAAVEEIIAPEDQTVVGLTPIVVQALIKNWSSASRTFDVSCEVDGNPIGTKNVTLASLDTTTVTFDPWTPTCPNGIYDLIVYTQLSGDEFTANDSASIQVYILRKTAAIVVSYEDSAPAESVGVALDALGYGYDLYWRGFNPYGSIGYTPWETVIWCEEGTECPNPAERDSLISFLNGGPNACEQTLIIAGQDIGWKLGWEGSGYRDTLFYDHYLHATYLADDGVGGPEEGKIVGVDINPEDTLVIWSRYPDVITSNATYPATGKAYKYGPNCNYADSAAGLLYDGDHNVVYYAFDFDDITNQVNEGIRSLMEGTLDWVVDHGGCIVVGVDEAEAPPAIPERFYLSQNYPNPFNPTTEIRYALPKDSRVRLEIYNVLGQKVRTLVNESQKAGYYRVCWDGKSQGGQMVASGIYFYRINAEGFNSTKKMILLR